MGIIPDNLMEAQMALGQNTHWIIVIAGLAITPKNDARYSLQFVTSEAANLYAQRNGYAEYEIVEVRA